VVVDFRNRRWNSCLRGGLRRCGGVQTHDGEENFWFGGTVICDCEVFSEISLLASFFNFTERMLIDGRMENGNLISFAFSHVPLHLMQLKIN